MTNMPPETSSSEHKRRDIASLAAPWASIVLTAVISALVLWQQSNEETDMYNDSNSDARMLAVYNEEHESLFPLSSEDKWGFALATLGLMIAAGGGIGGGGILVPSE